MIPTRGRGVLEQRDRLEAVEPGHREVEQQDVGLQLADALDAGRGVAGLADDAHVGVLLQREAQQRAQLGHVVAQEHADLSSLMRRGGSFFSTTTAGVARRRSPGPSSIAVPGSPSRSVMIARARTSVSSIA